MIRLPDHILSPSLYHDNVISMPRLHLHKLRVAGRARLQLIGRFLKRCIERAPNFPAKAASLSSFILRKLSGYLIELGTIT